MRRSCASPLSSSLPNRLRRLAASALVGVVATVLFAPDSRAQTGVVPETAGQNLVRWRDFDWKYVNILSDEDMGKGVRLYYYDAESDVAHRAAAAIEEEYRELVQRFDYKPDILIPYILYNSHQEFEQSNVFFVSEHILGVTSPTDLKMGLAYWGDHTRFRHTSLHEMTHQFTIQKVNAISDKARASGSPLSKIPLWFVEGIAEWYSTPGGMDAEAEMYLRDLVVNQDAFKGFVLPPFLSDDLRSFIYTYKLGQGRIQFIAETYGEGKIQEILENAYRLRGHRRPLIHDPRPQSPETATTQARREALESRERVLDFPGLLRHVTGDSPEEMQHKWEEWLKKRYFKQYLSSGQSYADFRVMRGTPEYADVFAAAHGGEVVVHRGIEPITGFTRLYMVDTRDPSSRVRLATDGRPGVDSLHFFDRPVVALTHDQVAFVARRGPTDALYIRKYKRQEVSTKELGPDSTRVRFHLGHERLAYLPRHDGIVEMGSPAFSPDGTQLAFIGLHEDGETDVFVLDLESERVSRLTADPYAEKELDWGAGGIVFNSDATEHGDYNLFLANPDTGKVRRLGWKKENQRYPSWTPDGRYIVYTADGEGKWDVYRIRMNQPSHDSGKMSRSGDAGVGTSLLASADGAGLPTAGPGGPVKPERITDFPTGITQARIVDKKLLAMGLKAGQFKLFSADVDALEAHDEKPQVPQEYGAYPIASVDLPEASEYTPWNWRSWALEDAFAVLSSSAYGGGFLLFNDRMRDRTAYLDFQIFGAPELTSANLVFLDRKRRTGWGTALFHNAYLYGDEYTSDPITPGAPAGTQFTQVLYVERTIGGAGLIEYPLSRYLRVTGGLGLAAVIRDPCYLTYTVQSNGQLLGDGPCLKYDFGPFDDSQRDRYNAWKSVYGGVDSVVQLSGSFGYDTLARSYSTGPLSGNSIKLSGEWNLLPQRSANYGEVQLDAQKYFRVWRTANLHFRFASGAAFGDKFVRQFFVWPIYNLRGIPFSSAYSDRFIGSYYTVGTSELQVPLDRLVRLAIFQNIEGIAAVDAGTVFNNNDQFESNRTAAFVTGVNFNLAIFQFRLHFAHPFDIGGLRPGGDADGDGREDLPNGWVTNFSIEYLFF